MVIIVACTPVQKKIAEIKAHQQLEEYREKLADGFFETVIQEARQIVLENDTDTPADVALYALGEVYAHHDYADRDLRLSQYYFEKLSENFPDSPLTSEARVYINLFETIAAKEKAAMDLEQDFLKRKRLELKMAQKSPKSGSRKIIKDQNFEEAIRKNLEILENTENVKSTDAALYRLGLLFAHHNNPDKDYKKSQIYFFLLTDQFPESEFSEEAQIWLSVFDTIDKMHQIDIEIDQQKKQLSR
ncbi:MAG: hypothetical protein WBB19_14905 [Desulforhopalus sp.]